MDELEQLIEALLGRSYNERVAEAREGNAPRRALGGPSEMARVLGSIPGPHLMAVEEAGVEEGTDPLRLVRRALGPGFVPNLGKDVVNIMAAVLNEGAIPAAEWLTGNNYQRVQGMPYGEPRGPNVMGLDEIRRIAEQTRETPTDTGKSYGTGPEPVMLQNIMDTAGPTGTPMFRIHGNEQPVMGSRGSFSTNKPIVEYPLPAPTEREKFESNLETILKKALIEGEGDFRESLAKNDNIMLLLADPELGPRVRAALMQGG